MALTKPKKQQKPAVGISESGFYILTKFRELGSPRISGDADQRPARADGLQCGGR